MVAYCLFALMSSLPSSHTPSIGINSTHRLGSRSVPISYQPSSMEKSTIISQYMNM